MGRGIEEGGGQWLKLVKKITMPSAHSRPLKAESLGGMWWVFSKASPGGANV